MKHYPIFIFILILSSCYNTRYLNRTKDYAEIEAITYSLNSEEYRLQPYDYLYVSVKSTNEEINTLYGNISSTYSGGLTNNESNFFLTGYLINDSGYVFIPTIGKILIKGRTIEEARTLIQNEFSKILTDAVINVRLTSFNVTFLGAVNREGRVPYYRERVNILEGIGSAGGISDFGDKKRVKIIRPQDSVVTVYELDLTDKNLITQKEFYLYPNDVVYVPPRKSKDVLDFIKDYSTIITLITGTITTTLLIIQLTK
ncbi:MAG: polysaccharide biosynthesis/export family protein [Bacteroidales bacterium]|nr:polysaccharide biosynthesis/export family protein [Bacteroidales bacterium]